MKCPKCNYITFDYEEVCPKCQKDLSEERRKLNLPSWKPEPPYLLGSLTGSLDTQAKNEIDFSNDLFKDNQQIEPEVRELQSVEAMEEAFNDIIELDDTSQAEGPEKEGLNDNDQEFSLSPEEPGLVLDFEDNDQKEDDDLSFSLKSFDLDLDLNETDTDESRPHDQR